MPYLGNDLQVAQPSYRNIDDISGSFNSSTTSFPLLVSGSAPVPFPINSNQCLISVAGVVQRPDDSGTEGFRISGGNIIFSSAPSTGADFFGVILAGADYVNVGANFPSGSAAAPSITFDSDLDTGIYNSAANQVSVSTAGSERLRIDSAGQVEVVSLGTASAPAFSFTSDSNTGIYSPGADQVAISTGGSGRLFVDASGNVKVGSTDDSNAGARYITIGAPGGTTGGLQLWSTTTGESYVQFGDGTATADNYRGYMGYLHANDALAFATASTERLRINSSGRVGIGTTNPIGKLHIGGVSAVTDAAIYIPTGGIQGDNGGVFEIANVGNTTSELKLNTRGTLTFYRTTSGALGGGSEMARFDSSGRLLVGTSTAAYNERLNATRTDTTTNSIVCNIYNSAATSTSKSTSALLRVSSNASGADAYVNVTDNVANNYNFGGNNGGAYVQANTNGVRLSNGGTSWAADSDERVKDIIEPIEDGLSKVGTLRPVIGKYKTDPEDKRRSFLIAQDVQAVLPEAVFDEQGTLMLAYTDTIPLLVAALKESKDRIEQLEAKVAALESA